MKLHGNAALSLNGRRRPVLSVIDDEVATVPAGAPVGSRGGAPV
jgi:hypothetical protein